MVENFLAPGQNECRLPGVGKPRPPGFWCVVVGGWGSRCQLSSWGSQQEGVTAGRVI